MTALTCDVQTPPDSVSRRTTSWPSLIPPSGSLMTLPSPFIFASSDRSMTSKTTPLGPHEALALRLLFVDVRASNRPPDSRTVLGLAALQSPSLTAFIVQYDALFLSKTLDAMLNYPRSLPFRAFSFIFIFACPRTKRSQVASGTALGRSSSFPCSNRTTSLYELDSYTSYLLVDLNSGQYEPLDACASLFHLAHNFLP